MLQRGELSVLLLGFLGGCSLIFDAASPPAVPSDADVDRDDGGASTDADPEGWFDTEYAQRLRFTVTNPVDEELIDFPVLLVVDSATLASSGLPDLENARLIVDGQLVPHEFDVGEGDRGVRANLWFAATLSANETHTYDLYFDSNLTNEGSTTDVWASYLRVWHLGEMTGAYADSATGVPANGGERQAEGAPAEGRIGGGVASGGGAGGEPMAKTLQPIEALQPTCMSVTGWVQPHADTGARSIARAIVDASSATDDPGYRLSYSDRGQGGPTANFSLVAASDTPVPITEESLLLPEAWAWVGVSLYLEASGSEAQLYVNGETAGAAVLFLSAPTISDAVTTLSIGSRIDGILDEIRISDTCRTDGWMRAQYQAMTPPYLPVLGDVETRP